MIRTYRNSWLAHVERIKDGRLPLHVLNYKPNGRRKIGRLRLMGGKV